MSAVKLMAYSEHWPLHFKCIRGQLLDTLVKSPEDAGCVIIEHTGSTAVPGLAAKPVIDVLLGVDTLARIEANIDALQQRGYRYVSKYEQELPMRRYFVKPGNEEHPRVHLHGVVTGSSFWHTHVAFRDALRRDDTLRTAYQTLKLELAARFADDKAAYTAAKAPFIQSVLKQVAADHVTG